MSFMQYVLLGKFTEYMLRPVCQERIPVALCLCTPGGISVLCLWEVEGFLFSFPPSLTTYALIHTTCIVVIEAVHALLPGVSCALFGSKSLATAVSEQGRVARDDMAG